FISDRKDSDFWRDCTETAKISDVLEERLSLWKNFVPTYYDFAADIEFFQRESYLAVLYGMDYPTRAVEGSGDYDRFVKGKVEEHFLKAESLAESLISQRQWFNEFYKYAAGVSKS